ncbi:MAG: flagellar hook-basal body complex protein FliE [Syntrophotaleaceae bacterium]
MKTMNIIDTSLPSPIATQKNAETGGGFSDQLKSAINSVTEAQANADQAVEKLHIGQGGSLHEVMIALEKADISTRLIVQLRNKAVDAYQEIMRMSV